MNITILNEAEIREYVPMDLEALERIEQGFAALAKGIVTLPQILRIDIPENHGEVDVKTAFIHGLDLFAIKIAAGFFDNHLYGLPSGSGMMVVISAKTGFPQAILLDNGYLTDVRTGLAGAVAARYLAPRRISTVGVIGAGTQARYQLRALRLVRDFQQVLVYSLGKDEVHQYVREMSSEFGVPINPANSPEEVVRRSQIVITTTPSHDPIVRSEWLHPGLHITCMGSDTENKQELYSDTFQYAHRISCDRRDQCFRLGELHHAREAGIITLDEQVSELGEIILGEQSSRQSEEEITICDLTGVGVQDTQIALLAFERDAQRRSVL